MISIIIFPSNFSGCLDQVILGTTLGAVIGIQFALLRQDAQN
jgi:hypothetical protein